MRSQAALNLSPRRTVYGAEAREGAMLKANGRDISIGIKGSECG